MLPEHYQARDLAQQIGFEGPDLAEKHRLAVLKSAKTISIDMIKCVNDSQFRVASQSYLSRYYLVDIQRLICDCPDFPRVQFCKHICAVKIWYPFIPPVDNQDQDLSRSAQIFSQMSATAPILSGKGQGQYPSKAEPAGPSGALPNRERLSPNQNLWAATAKRMGVKTPPKRHHPGCVAAVPSSTSQHIGLTGVKRKYLFTDAYNGGEQSGKRAKYDAVSSAANARARGTQ